MEVTLNKKAIGLLSGGLDSTLAVRIMLDMGIEITALNFMPNSSAPFDAWFLDHALLLVQVQNGLVKLRAVSCIPISNIILTASVLSNPPDNRPIAFLFNVTSISLFTHFYHK